MLILITTILITSCMDISQLEVFLAVAREGGFSRAADKLYRTQSAVSQSVRKLEAEIGEPLFDRSSREGLLTDAGRVLQEYAERLINLRENAREALTELRELQMGKLVVGANELTALYLLRRSEEHTSELQSPDHLVCRLLLDNKKTASSPKSPRAPASPTINSANKSALCSATTDTIPPTMR